MHTEPDEFVTAEHHQEEMLQVQLATLHAEKQNLQQRSAIQEGHMRQKDAELEAIRLTRINLLHDTPQREVDHARRKEERQLAKEEQRERLLGLEKRVYERQHIDCQKQVKAVDLVMEELQSKIRALRLAKDSAELLAHEDECNAEVTAPMQYVKKEDYPCQPLYEIVPSEDDDTWPQLSDGESNQTDEDVQTPDEDPEVTFSQPRSPQLQPLITGVIARIRKASTPDAIEHRASIINTCPNVPPNDYNSPACTTHTDGSGRKSSSASQQRPQKRPRETGNGEDLDNDSSEDEDDARPRKNSTASSKDGAQTRRLKCPYYQKDPWRHTRGSCRGVGFVDMAKLKDHLKRVHTRPLQCTRCWEDMQSPEAYDIHLRAEPICAISAAPVVDDRISPQTLQTLNFNRRPFAQVKTVGDKWRILFSMIFPAADVPSPYEEFGLNQGFDKCLADEVCEELAQDLPPGLDYVLEAFKGKIPDIIERSKKRSRRASHFPRSESALPQRMLQATHQQYYSESAYQHSSEHEPTAISPITSIFSNSKDIQGYAPTVASVSSNTLATSIFSTTSPFERPRTTSTSASSFPSSVSLTQLNVPHQKTLKRRTPSTQLSDLYTASQEQTIIPPTQLSDFYIKPAGHDIYPEELQFAHESTCKTPYPMQPHDPLLYGPVSSLEAHQRHMMGCSYTLPEGAATTQKLTMAAEIEALPFPLSGSEDFPFDLYEPSMQDMNG